MDRASKPLSITGRFYFDKNPTGRIPVEPALQRFSLVIPEPVYSYEAAALSRYDEYQDMMVEHMAQSFGVPYYLMTADYGIIEERIQSWHRAEIERVTKDCIEQMFKTGSLKPVRDIWRKSVATDEIGAEVAANIKSEIDNSKWGKRKCLTVRSPNPFASGTTDTQIHGPHSGYQETETWRHTLSRYTETFTRLSTESTIWRKPGSRGWPR